MASHSILSLTLLIAQPKTGLPLNVAVNVYISEGNLTAPKLISPENSSGIEIGDLITFRWSDVENTTSYTLQLDISKSFNTSNFLTIENINETEYVLNSSRLFLARWYWCVCAVYKNGSLVCSDIYTFSILPKRSMEPLFTLTDLLIYVLLIPMTFIAVAQIIKYRERKKS